MSHSSEKNNTFFHLLENQYIKNVEIIGEKVVFSFNGVDEQFDVVIRKIYNLLIELGSSKNSSPYKASNVFDLCKLIRDHIRPVIGVKNDLYVEISETEYDSMYDVVVDESILFENDITRFNDWFDELRIKNFVQLCDEHDGNLQCFLGDVREHWHIYHLNEDIEDCDLYEKYMDYFNEHVNFDKFREIYKKFSKTVDKCKKTK